MYTFEDMVVEERFDKKNGWTVLTFYQDGKEIGFMNVDKPNPFHSANTFVHTMSSYDSGKGNGTKMLRFLADIWHIEKINGDADPESVGFWNKFSPRWNEDFFEIFL